MYIYTYPLSVVGTHILDDLYIVTEVDNMLDQVQSEGSDYNNCILSHQQFGINDYLNTQLANGGSEDCPITSLEDVLNSGVYDPSPFGDKNTYSWLNEVINYPGDPPDSDPACVVYNNTRQQARGYVVEMLDNHTLDVCICICI